MRSMNLSHQQLECIKNFSEVIWQQDNDILSTLLGKYSQIYWIKSLLSGSYLNIKEINDNMCLNTVRNTYKKHEENTKEKKWQKWSKVEQR